MSEAKLLRTLADRLDDLEAVNQFPADIAEPGELSLTWSNGSDHDGYAGLNAAIAGLVKQHWSALRAQVVKQRETDVQMARAALLGVSPASTAGAVAPETSLRKIAG